MLYHDKCSKGAGYGDLPFHLNIISSFATGCNRMHDSFFKVDSVFYSGEKLAYPYMTNFLTAVYMTTGRATLRSALMFPSVFMALSLVFGMFYIGKLFSSNQYSNLIAIFIFCNLGGLGFTRLFDPTFKDGDLIHNWGDEIFEFWFHPIMHIIIPQRASLWSMPLCYWCIAVLIQGIQSMKWEAFLLASFYVAITPLVQMHSYVAMAQWAIVYCLLNFPWKSPKQRIQHIKYWAIFAIVANIFALPQFYPYIDRLEGKSDMSAYGASLQDNTFISFKGIWGHNRKVVTWKSPFLCWWRGLGVFAVITLVSGWVVLTKKQIMIYTPSIVIFILTNIIRYQPWELDNTKVFYAGWIPIAIHVYGEFMARVFQHKKLILIGIILIIASILSAMRYFLLTVIHSSTIFNDSAIHFGNWINENTPVHAIFMTSSWHGHPVLTLAGRQGYMGYGGWLLSHGLDYFGRYDKSRKMQTYPYDLERFYSHNVTYVVSKEKEFPIWNDVVASGGWIKIYDDKNYQCWKLTNMKYSTIYPNL